MVVRITGDASGYTNMLKSVGGITSRISSTVEMNAAKIDGVTRRLKQYGSTATSIVSGIAASIGVGGLISTAMGAIQRSVAAEQVELAFKTLIGDADRAKKAIGDLRKFAAETPFEMPELLAGAKQMISFGSQAEEIVPTMRMLGDVASGLNIPLQSLTYLFGTLKSQGRAFTIDIRQFAMRGIPIYQELQKVLGLTMDQAGRQQLDQMITDGKIGFPIVEKAFQNMTKEGGKYFNMMAEQSQTLGGLFSTLKDNIGMSLRVIGDLLVKELNLKGIVEDVGAIAGKVLEFINGLDSGTKQAIVAIIAMVAVVGVLTVAFFALKAIVTATFGGFNLILAAVIAGLTGVVVAGAGVITSMGGLAGMFAVIKQKAIEAWEWLKPIRQALASLWEAIKDLATTTWEEVKRVAIEAWQSITGDMEIDWKEVQDTIVRGIISVEFYIRNLKRTWDIVWFGAMVGYVILREELKHFFSTVIPVFLDNFAIGLQNVFNDAANNFKKLMENMVGNFIRVRRGLTSLLKGTVTFDDLWKPLTEGFENNLRKGMVDIPKRVVGPLEKMMRKMFGEMWDNLDADRKKFIEEKLKEFGLVTPETEEEAQEGGKKVGEEFNQGLDKEISKVDAALFDSAEALARLADYRERIAKKAVEPTPPQKATGLKGMYNAIKEQQDTQKAITEAFRAMFQPEANKALIKIQENTKQLVDKKPEGSLMASNLE